MWYYDKYIISVGDNRKINEIINIKIMITSEIFAFLYRVIIRYNAVFRLKPAQNSPMNFYIIKLKRISKLITIGKLKTHQPDRNKEIETEPDTVEFGFYI